MCMYALHEADSDLHLPLIGLKSTISLPYVSLTKVVLNLNEEEKFLYLFAIVCKALPP